jgi:uncharacterized protein (TIGR00255 family)
MTGFGYNEYQDSLYNFAMTLKSYNNRYLDIIVNVPASLSQLEPRFREYLASNVKRGRVELLLIVRELEEAIEVNLNKNIIHPYLNALNDLIQEAHLRDTINLSHLLRIEGILRSHKIYNMEGYWSKIEPILLKTFKEFEKTRSVEGERTKTNIKELMTKIKDNVDIIEDHIPRIEIKIRGMLEKKFHDLLKDEFDENKVLSETALFLIKFDIREEVVRMKSHIRSFNTALREKFPVGKRLDFICQELNREINTIGSKSFFLEVNNAVIAVKDSIETVREQLRNVE